MPGPYIFSYDGDATAGERLAPEIRAEIALVAPSAVNDGSITTIKIAAEAITKPKIAPGAVDADIIAAGGVETDNYADLSVTAGKLANDSVTPRACDTGVVLAVDDEDNDIEVTLKRLSATDYAAIITPDPNTWYFTHA